MGMGIRFCTSIIQELVSTSSTTDTSIWMGRTASGHRACRGVVKTLLLNSFDEPANSCQSIIWPMVSLRTYQ